MSIIFKSEIKEFKKTEVMQIVNKNGYVIIRGLFNRNELINCYKKLKENYNINKDKQSNAGTPKEIFGNFQKLCVGSSSVSEEKIYRLHRIIYNPTWSKNLYGLRNIFIRFNKIRNRILGFSDNFCLTKPQKKLWSACRILQYPVGGGHMSKHSDYILKSVSKINFKNKFYQLVLPITERNKNFQKGGAYIVHKKKVIDVEKFCKIGDILVYKTDILHGVQEIDPQKKLNLRTINGRIVLMNSLYQNFNKKPSKDKFFKKI